MHVQAQGLALRLVVLREVRQAKKVLRMPKVELSDTDLEIRRSAWAFIRQTVQDKSLSDREKLRRCLNEASNYASLTGDDSLFPPQIRAEHDEMCKWVKQNMEKIEKRKVALERDAASGQPMFGE